LVGAFGNPSLAMTRYASHPMVVSMSYDYTCTANLGLRVIVMRVFEEIFRWALEWEGERGSYLRHFEPGINKQKSPLPFNNPI